MKKLCLSLSAFLLLTITSMAQNVGIGTNNPASKLDVTGNLSIGSTFSGTAAPSNGAIIEGQVGIGTDTVLPGAALQVNSTDKGFLPPRIVLSSTLVSAPIANPTNGLLIFNTATNGAGPTAVTPGFYYWDTNHWERVNTGAGATGATGAQGATGANGTNGATGAAGVTGATGATGQDGQSELYATTSSSSITIGTGSKTLTVGTGLSYTVGQTVVIGNVTSGTLRTMTGSVTAYNSGTGAMTVNVATTSGTGTFTTWAVNLSGATQGLTGATGATGANGSNGATGATGATGAAGDKYATTSNTSNTISASGNKTFTVGTGLAYTVGQSVIAGFSATQYMIGTVSAYNSGTGSMTIAVSSSAGSGNNLNPWSINLNGATQGATGATGATGAAGATGSAGAVGATGAAGATGATGTGYAATSSTNTTIATGSKTFTTQAGLAYLSGLRVRVANSGTNYMEGTVTSYSGTSLVINVDRVIGSGTFTSWNIGLAGDAGLTGATGAAGTTGAAGATGAAGVTGATGSGYAATSTSSVLIGTGSKTFTTQAGLAYVTGLRVRVANSGTNYMEGTVTSYSGTSLVVNVDRVAGSGTLASWNIGIAGDVGAAGSTGAAGPTGATGATGVTASLLVSAARTTTYTATVAFNTLVYNTASVNVGGAYNTTTGEFTAPATGLYQVIVSNNYTVLNGLNNGLNGRVVINGTTDYESSIAMTPYNTTTIASALVMNDIVSMTSGQKLTITIGNLVNTMNPSVGTGQHVLKIIRLN